MRKFFRKQLTKKIFISSLFLIFGLFLSVQAASPSYSFMADSGLAVTGKQAGYDVGSPPKPEIIAGRAVELVLSLLGIAFLGYMIYAGLTWMTAQGNEQKVTKAKSMITESIVGLIIVIAAYAIAYFVVWYFSTNALV